MDNHHTVDGAIQQAYAQHIRRLLHKPLPDEPFVIAGFALMFGGAIVGSVAVALGASATVVGGLWFLAAVVGVNLMGR